MGREGKIQSDQEEDKQANHTAVVPAEKPQKLEIDICAAPPERRRRVQSIVGRLAPWPQFNGKSASKTIMTSRILHKTKLE